MYDIKAFLFQNTFFLNKDSCQPTYFVLFLFYYSKKSKDSLGSDLDLDPDLWKILWIRIWQNDADPLDLDLDPDPQHCLKVMH